VGSVHRTVGIAPRKRAFPYIWIWLSRTLLISTMTSGNRDGSQAFHSSHIAFAFSWFSISQYLIGSDQSEAFRDTSKLENAFAVELKDESGHEWPELTRRLCPTWLVHAWVIESSFPHAKPEPVASHKIDSCFPFP
jgi:hypothetical protein